MWLLFEFYLSTDIDNIIGQKRNQRAEVRSVAEYANAGYETAVDSKLNIISGF